MSIVRRCRRFKKLVDRELKWISDWGVVPCPVMHLSAHMYSEILTEGEVLFRTKDATESGNLILLVLLQQNTPERPS
jgi:hypothetical protein